MQNMKEPTKHAHSNTDLRYVWLSVALYIHDEHSGCIWHMLNFTSKESKNPIKNRRKDEIYIVE